MKTELLFDLESTGLLREGSTIHCIVMRNMDNVEEAEVFDYKPERALIQGVKALERADVLIGHNIIGYDIPLLQEQYPDFNPQGEQGTEPVLLFGMTRRRVGSDAPLTSSSRSPEGIQCRVAIEVNDDKVGSCSVVSLAVLLMEVGSAPPITAFDPPL